MQRTKLTDKAIAKMEAESVSRRRMIQDVCAATGWVFLNGAVVSRASEPIVLGDTTNDDKKWGSIKGRLVYKGDAPKMNEIELDKLGLAAKDLEWFKSTGPVMNQEWVIDPKSKSIQWVYVWLLPENPKGTFKPHESLLEIPKDKLLVPVDQDPIGYVPHAVAIQLGQGLLMRNKGPIGHVFNFTAFENESFNKAMAPNSEIVVDKIKLEKSAIQINCPPHPWERMWLRVFGHPYFAVTNANGEFEIKLAPSGKCRLVVWHEKAGFLGGKSGKDGSIINVEGGAVTDVGNLELTAKT